MSQDERWDEGGGWLTSLWDGVLDEDEDSLLRVELDSFTDYVNKLACRAVDNEKKGGTKL